jgi:hypothetical protein
MANNEMNKIQNQSQKIIILVYHKSVVTTFINLGGEKHRRTNTLYQISRSLTHSTALSEIFGDKKAGIPGRQQRHTWYMFSLFSSYSKHGNLYQEVNMYVAQSHIYLIFFCFEIMLRYNVLFSI